MVIGVINLPFLLGQHCLFAHTLHECCQQLTLDLTPNLLARVESTSLSAEQGAVSHLAEANAGS